MRVYIAVTILLFPCLLQAQKYPQGYFRNPLDIPILLAGNFGECRPNHFHSGLDIKTEARENLPVRAAADGYISRVRMQNGGFGHVLYLAHPNGYTTVYAHLNDFAPAVQMYMRAEQYRQKTWTVDLYPAATRFPVKKGDLIAYSGNTGGSTAPHLHFEIRDAKTENPVNPALFGFDINDKIAPKPTDVLLYNMEHSIYVAHTVGALLPKPQPLVVKGGIYTVKGDTLLVNTAKVGVAFMADDFMNNSTNTLTYHTAELRMDGVLQCKITLDNISYDVSRYMNAFADYAQKAKNKGWVQLLFQQPGNRLNSIYETNKQRGILDISDNNAHDVAITLTDAFGNVSNLSFFVRNSQVPDASPINCDEILYVNKDNNFSHPNVRFTMDDKALYDEVCFTFSEKADAGAYSSRYKLHESFVPVHTYFTLGIKPNIPVPFELRTKIAMVHNDGKKETGKAAAAASGWYNAEVRNFGEYRLVADTTAPKITPLQTKEALAKSARISFRTAEAVTSVQKFEGFIDGKWVPFEQSGDIFFYTFDEYCPAGSHTLKITASDENGNTTTLQYPFKR